MAYVNKTRTPYRKLYIKGHYNNYDDFHDINKNLIYTTIVEVFKGFTNQNKLVLSLYIQAIISGFEYDKEYKFKIKDTDMLTKTLLPYFEEIEDYEKCGEIMEILNNLNKPK